MIDNALRAAEHGAKLTGQLLAFSRRQRLEPGPVDVNALILGLSEMLRGTLGGTVLIETALEERLWFALVDVTQLELMILNLAINARDAMPRGGRIRIATANTVRAAPARPEEPEAGDYVEITVADDGTGISPDVLPRVFEPFFTTKPVGKGSGLGLSQVLGLAQQHGGGVALDSAPDVGTTVRVYLPRAAPPEAAPAERLPIEPTRQSLVGLSILLADDDPDVRSVLAEILEDLGCITTAVDSGPEALERLGTAERFDLLMVDYAMPGMSGGEVAARTRVMRPNLPVLMLTGYAQSGLLPVEFTQGHVVTKPVRPRELADIIMMILVGSPSGMPAMN